MIHAISQSLGGWLAQESGQPEKKNVLAYGLEYILGSVVKVVSVFGVAWLLGILFETFAFVGTFVGLRLFSGGVHNKTYWRCFSTSLVSSLGMAYLAKQTIPWIVTMPWTGWVIALGISFLMFLYAPSNPAVGFSGNSRRYWILRIGSIVIPWLLPMLLLFSLLQPSIVQAVAYGILVQGLSVTPWGGKFILHLDVIMDRK